MAATARKWDTHEIKAELARRGYTLTQLARDNGLPENACRRALSSSCLPGALVIAKTLEVSVQDLWPGRYIRRRNHPATTSPAEASLKCDASTDIGRVA
jgi:Ner family transcriptional regulator